MRCVLQKEAFCLKFIQAETTQFYGHLEFVNVMVWKKTFPFFFFFSLNWIYLCYSSSFQNMCSSAFSLPNLPPGHKAKAFTACAEASKMGDVWMCTGCVAPLLNAISFFFFSYVIGILFSCINLDSNVTITVEFISKTHNRNYVHGIKSFQSNRCSH